MIGLKGRKILIVDDEPDLREILIDEFDMAGAIVLEAESGRSGIEILKNHEVDAIVSDIRMAQGSGIELLDAVRVKHHSKPAVVLITGFADITFEEAYDKGADAIFSKPFNISDLLLTVERLISPDAQKFKRKNERLRMAINVQMSLPNLPEAIKAHTLNLGRGGMFVAYSQNLPAVGEAISFEIHFKDGNYTPLKGNGICRWVRENGDATFPPGFGVEFLDLEDEAIQRLNQLLEARATKAHIPRI